MGKFENVEQQNNKPQPQLQLQPPQQAEGININGESAAGAAVAKPGGGERVKRDEWSEGAVTSLLDAYESKWLLRNRAKLKGNDWEEVARHVSVRLDGSKSVKTQTQCKNKIESMKKRYRAESNNAQNASSSWPLYGRMDNLLRCRTVAAPSPPNQQTPIIPDLDPQPIQILRPLPLPPPENGRPEAAEANGRGEEEEEEEEAAAVAQTQDSNEDGSNTLLQRRESVAVDTDTSTPRSKIANADGDQTGKRFGELNLSAKRRKGNNSVGNEVAESIRSLAETLVKLEQAKIRMYKDSERLRAETEVRRGEMELKRTEIIAKTQLQIARLLSGKNGKRKFADRNSTLPLTAPSEGAAQAPTHSLLPD